MEVSAAEAQGAESGKVLFNTGDVLYSKIRPNLHKVCLAPFDGICSSDIYPIVPNAQMAACYQHYIMLSTGFHQLTVLDVIGATIPRIDHDSLMHITLAVPPLAEQYASAGFLDRETARIDARIDKYERLNALLREKRVAVISEAVSKGLDPATPLKDSGAEWLGMIPAHWEVKRLRHVVKTGPTKSELRNKSDEIEVSFLPMPAIGEKGELDLSEVKHVGDVYDGYTYFSENDVIVAKITACFENGKGAIAKRLLNGIGFGTTELYVLRPGPDTHSYFIYYLTVSSRFRSVGTVNMQGAAGH